MKSAPLANEVVAVHLAYDLNVTDLDNAGWHNAQSVQINRYWSGEPAPASRHAEARLACPACGFVSPPAANFCSACGLGLTARKDPPG